MSTRIWRGDAPAVAQVDTATPANVEIDDIFTLTINGKSVSFTATAATVANVTAGLVAAWNASTIPEHAEITATDSTTHVTLTADTAGKPFTLTGSATDGGGTDTQTLSVTTTTNCSGPNHWDVAANWSGGAVPVNGDDVVFENSAVSVKYGLDQSSVTLDSLTVRQSYTGQIGLPRTNSDAGTSSTYIEYRETYLAVGATSVSIGSGDGSGSGRIKLDTGSVQTAIVVYGTGNQAEVGLEALLWKGTHASNTLDVLKGTVGAAVLAGETATLATLRVGYQSNQLGDATVRCGSGVTLTTIDKSGGTLVIESNVTTLTQTAGDLYVRGSAAVTTLNADGGKVFDESTGTMTTANVAAGVTLDFSRQTQSKTVTNCNAYDGATIRDPHKRVTWTNGVDLVRCGLRNDRNQGALLDIGEHFTVTPSAI